VSDVQYDLWARRKDAGCGLSIRSSAEPLQSKAVFDALHAKRAEIERAIGYPVKWWRLDDKKTSVIEVGSAEEGYSSPRTVWPTIAHTMVESMRRVEAACEPHLHAINLARASKGSRQPHASFLLTWNPTRWPWDDLKRECERLSRGEPVVTRWSTGNTRRIGIGDELFLLKQGDAPRGIVAHGRAVSDVFDQPHWDDERRAQGENAFYVMVQWTQILNPAEHPPLLVQGVTSTHLASVNWSTQESGISIPTEAADELRRLWLGHVGSLGSHNEEFATADEVTEIVLHEGALRRITVNAYERNPVARQKCIDHWGSRCYCCGLEMGERYGPVAQGFIHVHHLKPLASIGEAYRVDPVTDLRPVCPNCHAVIHMTNPPASVDELRRSLSGI
jgi:5-methylcytosine-specific restriction protein A